MDNPNTLKIHIRTRLVLLHLTETHYSKTLLYTSLLGLMSGLVSRTATTFPGTWT